MKVSDMHSDGPWLYLYYGHKHTGEYYVRKLEQFIPEIKTLRQHSLNDVGEFALALGRDTVFGIRHVPKENCEYDISWLEDL